jgi:hypothetical protein
MLLNRFDPHLTDNIISDPGEHYHELIVKIQGIMCNFRINYQTFENVQKIVPFIPTV